MQRWIQRKRRRTGRPGGPQDTRRGRRRHTLITDRTRKAFGSFFYVPEKEERGGFYKINGEKFIN
ncbi:hypothetical protein BEI64_14940 [Eisenbergiella tayi]|uniref:Uncharacterized protein n=1 Tax=Eisenbergiella tayi TaxID=1432052 RepID=A0ABX3AIE8_9FIRM|nr:hypothetical protein BEI63_09495 [Eisenbergiella tayi]ODR58739.1 hypothetical protein BEI64_14940 [Eisenbergiella tayi]